jgi:hypothetical protein
MPVYSDFGEFASPPIYQRLAMADVNDNPLDFFTGGVPASVIFSMATGDLRNVLFLGETDRGRRTIRELVIIGAVGYFEAFCKDHFAAILNIAPFLIQRLSSANVDTKIDALSIVQLERRLRQPVGFLLAERLQFGTATEINKLYTHILRVTPFSKAEAERFSELLRDRNLLVHHGGIYTETYARQIKAPPHDAYYQSKIVSEAEVKEAIDFLIAVATSLVKSTKQALHRSIAESAYSLSEAASGALSMLDAELD